MSELTKIEELKQKARKVYSEKNLAAVYDVCCEFEDLARELLALRSLRDAGDEEVYVCLRGNNVVYQNRSGGWDSQLVYPDFCRLRDIAITRGQQLREAREEIERLSGKLEETQETAISFSQQIATLTADRDEARKGENTQCTIRYMLQDELDAVKAELAALKSCPAMAEVDALMEAIAEAPNLSPRMKSAALKGADLARRSIASREEVVGKLTDTERLIKWMVKHWDWTGKLESIAEGCVIEPWKENARLVLEIVEGK